MTQPPIDVAIIGAPKCGTTSLYTWLAAHPGVQGSEPKETLFFVTRGGDLFIWQGPEASWPTYEEHGWSGFEHFFPEPRRGRLRVEASPVNLYNPLAIAPLAEVDPQPLVIVALRDPAELIRSGFYFAQRNGAAGNFIDENLSFSGYVEALLSGDPKLAKETIPHDQLRAGFGDFRAFSRYVEYLDPWAEKFANDRIVVLRFDDLVGRPRDVVNAICQRAGLDASFYDDYEFVRHNPTIRRRRDRLDAWGYAARRLLPAGEVSDFLTRVYKRVRPVGVIGGPGPDETAAMIALREYFAPYNTELAERYGVDVSPWMPSLVEHAR